MFMLLSTAFALDCTGLTAETCDAVNAMEAAIEAARGDDLINDSGPARFNPTNLYNRLENVRLALGDDGCRVDYSFDGWDAGSFGYGSFDGDWSGGSNTGTSGGSFAAKQVDGTYGGDASGTIGDVFGKYNKQGQVAANRDAGFHAGYWIRVAGKRGIYVTLTGDCDSGVNENEALDPWFIGQLPATPPAPQDITFRGTADDQITVYVDGVDISLPGAGNWQAPGTSIVPLTPGDHLVAVQGTDVFGPPSMVQLRATDAQGNVLLTSNTTAFVSNDVSAATTGWNTELGFDDSGWATPTSCGPAGSAPWGDPIGGGNAPFMWHGGSCSTVGSRVFRAILTVP